MNAKSKRPSFTPTPIHWCGGLPPTPKILVWGFTLIELLMVIAIIIILAGIAIPNFAKAKERALTKEAIANLKLIAVAEKAYRMGHSTYYGPEGGISNINTNLRLYFTNETYWDYAITAATADTFTATAQRTSGPYSACIYTINQGTTGEPTPQVPGDCP